MKEVEMEIRWHSEQRTVMNKTFVGEIMTGETQAVEDGANDAKDMGAGMSRAPGAWLTVRETAQRFGITTAAVRAAIHDGRLPDERNERGLTIIRVWQADELWQYRLLQSDTEWVSDEEWITVPEIANRYGIDRSYVYELIRLNRLTAKRGTHNQLIVPAKVAHELWENRLLKAQGLRQCKACLKVKPLEEFAKSKKRRRRMCRTCINKMMRRWKMARMMQKIWGRG